MKKPFGNNKPRPFAPSGDKSFKGGKFGSKPKKKYGDDRSREGSPSGDRRSYGEKPAWKKDRPGFKSDRPAWKSDRHEDDRPRRSEDSGERRSYGDKPKWNSEKPAWKSDKPVWKSDRPGGGDRPRYEGGGERRPYGEKPSWKKDKRDWKADRPASGDRPRFEDRGERKQYGDKPSWKKDRPDFKSDRPAWKLDKPGGDNKPRRFNNKPRPYGNKPDWKSDKPSFKTDRPPFKQGRPSWKSDRPTGGDRPRYEGAGEKRPYGDKPAWKSDKPAWKSDRPAHKAERPAWKPEANFLKSKSARDSVTVPYNKKNQEESVPESAPRRDFAEKFSRPVYNRNTDAKTLIVTLEDTHNVPVRLVWIYDSMVGDLPDGEPAAGDTVYVYDSNNRFIGSAIYNPHSRIRARIFSLTRRMFDQSYLREMIEKAITTRRDLGLLNESCRAVFGEGDGIPGLIADKIGDYLVIQPLTYAVNRHLTFIVDQLNAQLAPEGIVVRTDVPIRAKEGLNVEPPAIHGEVPERVEIREDGSVLFANPSGGQKTGLFLDQRLNRAAMKPFCNGARVLDLFCHVGGWAMRAAKYGAAEVIGVDSSESALDLAKAGATANGYSNVSFVEDDVFEYLRKLDPEPENLFDIIVCDPPAFAKTRSHYEEAFRAYLSLNYLVMKKLKPGGVLITCSCSQAVSPLEFNEAILTSARNARMQFQILERRGAPQDHPVLLGLPESEYLKCFILKRVE